MSIEQFEEEFNRKFIRKKQANTVISVLIFILGFSSIIYKANYEGDFWTCFREMTFCGTVFTTLVAFITVFLSLYERKHAYEFTCGWLYTLRLSACTTEFIIFVVVMIGFLPCFSTDPTILRYDMMNMHVLIPILMVVSFTFNDAPVGKLTAKEHLGSLAFLTLYALGQLICILNGLYPRQEVAYFFLDVMNQPWWFTAFAVAFMYGLGYGLGSLFAYLNRKGSWYWYRLKIK